MKGLPNNTEALSRWRESAGESRRAALGWDAPFDGPSRYASAAQGYGYKSNG